MVPLRTLSSSSPLSLLRLYLCLITTKWLPYLQHDIHMLDEERIRQTVQCMCLLSLPFLGATPSNLPSPPMNSNCHLAPPARGAGTCGLRGALHGSQQDSILSAGGGRAVDVV
jgi:hypothetical protein